MMDVSEYPLRETWLVQTPALVIYPRIVDDNIRALLGIAGGYESPLLQVQRDEN